MSKESFGSMGHEIFDGVQFSEPSHEEVNEVTLGDFSQVQSPAEAWGVTEVQIDIIDQEALAKSEDPGEGYWDQPGMAGA